MKIIINFIKFVYRYFLKYYTSINNAIEGILQATHSERHVRLHFFVVISLLIFCFALGIRMNDIIILTIMACVVIVTEIINSAIEVVVDLASPEAHEKARVSKDMAAGAVFVAAIASIIVAYYILKPYYYKIMENGIELAKHGNGDVAVSAIIIVLIFVIMLKSYFGTGHPLKGGFPSGHSALSFSIFISVLFFTNNIIIIAIFGLTALSISISRIILKIHSFKEVFAGIFLGSTITFALHHFFSDSWLS